MKYSKTTLKELTARYRAVLHKCFLLNMALMVPCVVLADDITLTQDTNTYQYIDSLTVKDQVLSVTDALSVGTNHLLVENGTLNIEGKKIADSSALGNGSYSGESYKETGVYASNAELNNAMLNITDIGELEVRQDLTATDSTISVKGSGLEFEYEEDDPQYGEGWDNEESEVFAENFVMKGSDVSKSNLILADGGCVTVRNAINIEKTTIDISSDGQLESEGSITISDSILNMKYGEGPEPGSVETDGKLVTLNNTKTTFDDGAEIRVDDGTYGGQKLTYAEFAADKELVEKFGGYDNEYDNAFDAYDDYEDYMRGNTVYDFGTLDVNGGEIKVVKGVESFEFPTTNDVYFSTKANLIMAKDVNLTNKAQLNVEEGATLFTLKHSDYTLPISNASINVDSTSAVNLGGTLHADITGQGGQLNVTHNNAKVVGSITGMDIDLGASTLIANSVEMTDNSTLSFEVAGKEAGQYGSIKADSIKISENGTTIKASVNSGVLTKGKSTTLQVLDSTAITGSFANLEIADNIRYSFEVVGDGAYKITYIASAADVAGDDKPSEPDTPGESTQPSNPTPGMTQDQVVADAWVDKGGFQEGTVAYNIFKHLDELSQHGKEAFKEAIKALQPDSAPTEQSMAGAINNQIANAIAGRLGGTPSVGPMGRAGGDVFQNSAVWAQALVNKAKLDTTNGFDGKTHGLAMGVDGEVAPNVRAGFGYAYTNSDIDATGRSTDVDTHTIIAYGQYDWNNAFVNGLITYGRSDYEESKDVSGLKVKADYDVDAIYMQAMTGYHYGLGIATVTPQAGLRYLWTKTHGYTDTASQTVSGNTTDTLTGVLGAKVTTSFKADDAIVTPSFKLATTYDFVNDKGGSTVRLSNGASYAVGGKTLKRFGVEVGTGVSTQIGNIEFGLNYEGRFKKDYTDHTGLINFKYHF